MPKDGCVVSSTAAKTSSNASKEKVRQRKKLKEGQRDRHISRATRGAGEGGGARVGVLGGESSNCSKKAPGTGACGSDVRLVSLALSAWRSGGGGGSGGRGPCSRSVYGAISRRECAGMSVRPSAGLLLRAVTSHLRPVEWCCVRGGVGGMGNAVGGELSGVCVSACHGVVVAAGRYGVSVQKACRKESKHFCI